MWNITTNFFGLKKTHATYHLIVMGWYCCFISEMCPSPVVGKNHLVSLPGPTPPPLLEQGKSKYLMPPLFQYSVCFHLSQNPCRWSWMCGALLSSFFCPFPTLKIFSGWWKEGKKDQFKPMQGKAHTTV